MRTRHTIVELTEVNDPRSFDLIDATDGGFGCDLLGHDLLGENLELIDDSVVPQPILSAELSDRAERPVSRSTGSAVPASNPISQQEVHLAWGLGTEGWPRHNSRLVRLFVCDPADFTDAVVGNSWGCLNLSAKTHASRASSRATQGWSRLIDGTMQMPYRSRPLEIELEVQPFQNRYSRVDIVLRSRHRWPRRYFDVASLCLTQMQRLEQPRSLAPPNSA